MDTLAVQLTLPLAGCVEDLHLQVNAPCRACLLYTSPAAGGGLLALYGICANMYREVGGAEAFIRSERENFGSIAPDFDEPAKAHS